MHFSSSFSLAILHAICIVFTYFASFIGNEDDIVEVISVLHVQLSKIVGKLDQFGRFFLKLNPAEFMDLVFSKSASGNFFFNLIFST